MRFCIGILLLVSACTQTPSQVDLRGDNSYGRNGERQHSSVKPTSPRFAYRAPAPEAYQPPPVYRNVETSTSKTASVQSIGVSDLPPPSSAQAQPIETAPIKEHASSGYMWPVDSRKIVSGFGPKGAGKTNDGINIAAAEGDPVWAAADGEVVYADNELGGYGNMVLIKHSGGKTTSYAHLARTTVDKYDRVKQGDIVGYVGTTGSVKKPQLHFAVRNGKTPVDPKKYLSTSVAGI